MSGEVRDRETEVFEGRRSVRLSGDRVHPGALCMTASAAIVTAMIERSSLSDGVKRMRLLAIFAEANLDRNTRSFPRRSPKVHAAKKVMNVLRIVYACLMDAAPSQVAWDGGAITGTSTSVKFCSSLPHQLARRTADGRSRSAYRDERERNGSHASEDSRRARPPNREEATGT